MIDFLCFLLGVLLGTRWIAASYAIVDLWYCRQQYWPRIIGNIFLWSVIIAIVGLLTMPAHHIAFAAGLGFFAIFHIAIYWVGQIIRHMLEKQR